MKARGVKLLIETLTQQGNYNRLSKQPFSPWIRQPIGPSDKKIKKNKSVRLVRGRTSVRIHFGSPFCSNLLVYGHCHVTLPLTIIETL